MKSIVLSLVVLASGVALAVRTPPSAAFAKWQDSGSPRTGGWRPSPADLSHLGKSYRMRAEASAAAASGRMRLKAGEPIPARWDSREHGWVTPIRNQNPYGTCWAHSTMAAIETSFLKATNGAVTNDFSENHLAAHDVGFALGFDDGGNDDIAAALLTAWRDPLLESQDPYADPSSTVDLPPACHVQDIVWIPERTVTQTLTSEQMAATNEAIKRAVMEYGALSVSYYHYWNNCNTANGAYYVTAQNVSGDGGGHAVTLIGWDDAYPVSNFRSGKQPPGPGAFLIKNSWGKSYGDGGCLWISYYDQWFCSERSSAYSKPETTNNYGRIYQYDPCGFVESYNVQESGDNPLKPVTNWCANVFTTVATGIVEAVGFYALSAGTEYEIRAYADCASGPASGRLVSSQSGVFETAGYKTVRLAVPMAVGLREKFAVAASLKCPGTAYPLAVESSTVYPGYCTTTANAGESWYSKDGAVWKDFQRFDPIGNFCVKAYTRFGSDGDVPRDLIAGAEPFETLVGMWVGETNTFSVVPVAGAGELEYSWSLSGRPLEGEGASLAFVPQRQDHGNRVLSCRVTDGVGADVREWSLAINDELRSGDYGSLQAAVNDAIEGDRVLVAPGTYPPLEGPSVAIDIIAEEGPDVTVIDAQGSGRCYFGYYNASTALQGFTLANGSINNLGGGACYGTLVGCIVENCFALCGGGAYQARLVDCLVTGCRAVAMRTPRGWNYGYGGGVMDCSLFGCTVAGNEADLIGGGADGGLYDSQDSYTAAYNTIISSNACANAGGGQDVWANAAFYCEHSLVGLEAGFADAANGDYRLKAGSPAIDSGTNGYVITERDLDGNARVFGPRVDMGCFEYCHVPENWPVPAVEPGATAAEEAAAVSSAMTKVGFSPDVATNVTSVADYSKINAWAEANGVPVGEHAASPTALLSPALGAAGLLPLTADDVVLSEFALGTNATGRLSATMKLSLEAYDRMRADPSLLKAAVGVVGSDTPGGSYSARDLSVSVAPVADGIELTATPPEGRTSYFLKAAVR